MHEHKGQMRITGFDMIDQSLGFMRMKSKKSGSIWKRRSRGCSRRARSFASPRCLGLKADSADVYERLHMGWSTRDAPLNTWTEEVSQSLELDPKKLEGWN